LTARHPQPPAVPACAGVARRPLPILEEPDRRQDRPHPGGERPTRTYRRVEAVLHDFFSDGMSSAAQDPRRVAPAAAGVLGVRPV